MYLTAEEKTFIDKARDFVDTEIRPKAAEIEEGNGLSCDLIKKMGALGFLVVCIPKEYGGLEYNP